MTRRADRQLVGRWRIVEADLWEQDLLDLVGPAMLTVRADGQGEIAFGARQTGLDIDYVPFMVFFTWFGFDDGRSHRNRLGRAAGRRLSRDRVCRSSRRRAILKAVRESS